MLNEHALKSYTDINSASITANESNISANSSNIETNSSSININASNIETNSSALDVNSSLIAELLNFEVNTGTKINVKTLYLRGIIPTAGGFPQYYHNLSSLTAILSVTTAVYSTTSNGFNVYDNKGADSTETFDLGYNASYIRFGNMSGAVYGDQSVIISIDYDADKAGTPD